MEKAVNRYLENFLNGSSIVTPSVALARASSLWRIPVFLAKRSQIHIPQKRAPSLRELAAKLTEGVKFHAFGIFRTTTV